MRTRYSLLMASLCCLVGQANAQFPIVDIGMVALPDGRLEVRMRPDLGFNGIFAALVFTVRWDASSSATLGEFTPTAEVADYNMYPSVPPPPDDVYQSGGYNYSTFTGFGGSLSAQGQSWTADQEFVLGHIAVNNGPANFQLVNDTWTQSHNGNYYVSLNGSEQNGVIYEISTGMVDPGSEKVGFALSPNPARSEGRLTMEQSTAGLLTIEILDAAGRSVQRSSKVVPAGRSTTTIDASTLVPGAYLVRVDAPGGSYSTRWVVQRP